MSKTDKQLARQVESLVALGDPARRALYLHILSRKDEVSRDQAARAVHLSRSVAAFHLDKLVDAGLLEVSFRRLSGRTGPGAGRPSKLYRRSSRQIDVTLPTRRYDLAARLMAQAVSGGGVVATAALENAAESWGQQIGREARERAGPQIDAARLLRVAVEALRDAGFEPRHERSSGRVLLENCPFDALRCEAPPMICRMNLALCRGLVAGLQATHWSVSLEPRPERCCVVLQTK